MKYTAVLLSLSLFVSVGVFAGQALADEAEKKSQTISRAALSLPSKGLPNILPAMSVLTLCSLPTIRRPFPVRTSPSSRVPDPYGTFTRQGIT